MAVRTSILSHLGFALFFCHFSDLLIYSYVALLDSNLNQDTTKDDVCSMIVLLLPRWASEAVPIEEKVIQSRNDTGK